MAMTEMGKKIRALRQRLGLSQQQLAGAEMTRAFISQVESGKCSPSKRSLQLIAQRLGKTAEYFLMDEDEDAPNIALALIETAEREFAGGSAESGVHRRLQRALGLLVNCDAPELEGRARLLLARVLRKEKEYARARQECEQALTCFRKLADRVSIAHVLLELGGAAYRQEDFLGARQAYEEARLYCTGLKTMQETYVTCLTMLGSTLYCLGEHAEATERYQEAWSESQTLIDPVRQGRIAMGLGWTLFCADQHQEARRWTRTAISLLGQGHASERTAAEHNLALIEAALGSWERAYVILQSCFRYYEEQGQPERQANVLEDMARYWYQKGDLTRTEQVCWQAIQLLDLMDNRVLRGRLYRLLGMVATGRNELRQAYLLQKISLDLLGTVNAVADMELSRTELKAVQERLSSAPESALTEARLG